MNTEDCYAKLEELKKWQESQQQILLEHQKAEMSMLQFQKVYEKLDAKKSIDKSVTEIKFSSNNKNNPVEFQQNHIIPKPFLKRGEGLQNRFKVHPDTFKLNNLPKYKFSKKNVIRNKPKTAENNFKEIKEPNEIKESKVQSYPTPQPSAITTPIIQNVEKINPIMKNISIDSSEKQLIWKNMLGPSSTLQINKNLSQFEKEMDELDIFELLENKMDNSSFCSNASSIIRLLNNHNKNKIINPDEALNESNFDNLSLQPNPRYLVNENDKLESHSSLSSNSDDDDDEDDSEESSIHVRFSDKITVNEVDNVSLIDSESISSDNPLLNTSNDDNNENNDNCDDDNDDGDNDYTEQMAILVQTLLKSKEKEVEEKNEILKERLEKLENEIDIFQKQNLILTKMKQEHELYKIELENNFKKKNDELENERNKIEIFLNNEKVKLADEKMKLDKRLNELKNPTKKERDEIIKLKNTITEIQQQTKLKETRLISSQTRLRAQIRTLENQIKERDTEIEILKKQNKKIDSENVRLRRQNNNKMLLEINKNISKLVPVIETQQTQIKQKQNIEKISSVNKKTCSSNIKQNKIELSICSSDSDTESEINSDSSNNESDNNPDTHRPDNKQILQDNKFKQLNKQIDLGDTSNNSRISESTKSLKREIQNLDGSKDIWYPNGNIKKISADGFIIKMLYYNKDIKETNINEGTTKYYYAETNVWHTTYLDGLEIFEFPNGLTEHRHKNGKIEGHYSNGSIRITNINDTELEEEWQYPDGTFVTIKKNGDKVLTMSNGQREIHTKENKRREYPDGTIKIVYPDGSQETRYSNGRVRLKDKDNKLIMDSEKMKNK